MLYDAFTDFNYDPDVYFAQNGNPGQSEILPVPTKRRRGRPRKQFAENRPVIGQPVQPVRPATTTGRSLRPREKPKENKIEIVPKAVQVPTPGPRARGRPRKNIENRPVAPVVVRPPRPSRPRGRPRKHKIKIIKGTGIYSRYNLI